MAKLELFSTFTLLTLYFFRMSNFFVLTNPKIKIEINDILLLHTITKRNIVSCECFGVYLVYWWIPYELLYLLIDIWYSNTAVLGIVLLYLRAATVEDCSTVIYNISCDAACGRKKCTVLADNFRCTRDIWGMKHECHVKRMCLIESILL